LSSAIFTGWLVEPGAYPDDLMPLLFEVLVRDLIVRHVACKSGIIVRLAPNCPTAAGRPQQDEA